MWNTQRTLLTAAVPAAGVGVHGDGVQWWMGFDMVVLHTFMARNNK